jgi:Na+-driven multidrug efflux pump
MGAIIMSAVLIFGWGGLRLDSDQLRPHPPTLMTILKVAVPNFLETFLGIWVANFLVLRIVGQLHDQAAWAAHIVTVRAEALSYMPGFAFGMAAATLSGQYLGLGDRVRAKRAVLLCWAYGASVMLAMGLLFIALPESFIRLITDEPEILRTSPRLLRIAGCVQVFYGTAIILGQGMRGAGDTATTMALTTLSTYTVRLPLAYVFGVRLDWGLSGIWCALCVELLFRGLFFAMRFFYGRWNEISPS